jgi:hypothetical protein
MIPKSLMEILACPACRGTVREESETIRCDSCGRIYPVREGIPIMLIEESRKEGGRASENDPLPNPDGTSNP